MICASLSKEIKRGWLLKELNCSCFATRAVDVAGFFEAGNFYPDFLLWLVKDGKQHLAFVEPHGLQHEGPGHKKIEFHQVIKASRRGWPVRMSY